MGHVEGVEVGVAEFHLQPQRLGENLVEGGGVFPPKRKGEVVGAAQGEAVVEGETGEGAALFIKRYWPGLRR